MPLDESFPAENAPAPAAEAVEAQAAPVEAPADTDQPNTQDEAADTPQGEETAPELDADADGQPTETADEDPAAAAAPAFDEKAYLKQHFGDDAPDTPQALKEQLTALKASQLTDEQKGTLALLSDPAKLADFARLAAKDYDTPTPAEVMREKFALDHPGMSDKLLDFRFGQTFAQKYPTLAAALQDPDDYADDDPQLLLETEAADFDAKADRAALKTHQQTTTQQLLAAARAAAAPTAAQYTPAQEAEAQAALRWADETIKEGYTLPVDVGNGLIIKMPVGDPASFKEAFASADQLYQAQVLTPEGKLNPQAQAKIALFLRNPAAYDAALANAVKAAGGPALPLSELTNSSSGRGPTKAAAPPRSAAPAYSQSDDWLNSNA